LFLFCDLRKQRIPKIMEKTHSKHIQLMQLRPILLRQEVAILLHRTSYKVWRLEVF